MKVLFIGGTGVISSACTELAVARGMDVFLLNRGKSHRRIPEGATLLHADIRDPQRVEAALQDHTFDVVVDWVAFSPDHVETDIQLFQGRTYQYIFISSASAYQVPPTLLPITESTPLRNPVWAYSQAKIACEEMLVHAYREDGFPATIVRPSHTYDRTMLPIRGGFTMIDRMRKGKKVIIHGDGSSIWTLTHHADFAKGFTGLLGNPRAIGEAFHITSDEWLTWEQIFKILAKAAGAELDPVYIPSDLIAAYDPDWGASLLGDKSYSKIFDNSKIKRLVPDYTASIPFVHGVEEIIAYYDEDPNRQFVDEKFDYILDRIIAAYESVWPNHL